MLDNKSFTSFYPVNSPVHKMNSTVKLICLLLLLVPIIGSLDIKLHAIMLFATIYLLISSNVPMRFYLDSVYSLRYILIILVFILAFNSTYFETAGSIILKIVILTLYLSMLFYNTSASELKYGIEKILSPFNLFNINISPLINGLVNAITFFPNLFITEKSVLVSASSRGLDYFHTDILSRFYALILSFKNTLRLTKERTNKIKFAATLKGYSTKKYRTNLRSNKVGFNDIFVLLIFIGFIVYFVLTREALWDI